MVEFNIDTVICIDGTSSMKPFIEEVKANAISFYQKIFDAMEENYVGVSQLRIKVIVFRDYRCEEPMVESTFYTLPNQNEEFQNFVNAITTFGGGDMPKNALEAIALSLKSDWTTSGYKRRHVISVFSDTPALPLGEGADSPNYPSGMPKDIIELSSWWEGTDPSFNGTYQPRAGRLIAFVPNASPWNDELIKWPRYWPLYSKAGTGLNEVDIQSAIDVMVGTF